MYLPWSLRARGRRRAARGERGGHTAAEPTAAVRPGAPPASWPGVQPASWPDVQPASWPDAQPATWPDAQPASLPDVQPASLLGVRLASSPDVVRPAAVYSLGALPASVRCSFAPWSVSEDTASTDCYAASGVLAACDTGLESVDKGGLNSVIRHGDKKS